VAESDNSSRFQATPEQLESFELYRTAAHQGVAGAQCRLGIMYATGQGVLKDDIAAAHWFRLAAEQGDIEAQGGLALAYASGRGVTQDFVAAHMWISLAIEELTGDVQKRAIAFRDGLSTALTTEQQETAEQLARNWTPSNQQSSDA
tara:strand:- start:3 stop:443 length:441 start_codon:yes stop_codon:yes gene_type:complete